MAVRAPCSLPRAAQGGLTPSISHDELREQVKQALRTTR